MAVSGVVFHVQFCKPVYLPELGSKVPNNILVPKRDYGTNFRPAIVVISSIICLVVTERTAKLLAAMRRHKFVAGDNCNYEINN